MSGNLDHQIRQNIIKSRLIESALDNPASFVDHELTGVRVIGDRYELSV